MSAKEVSSLLASAQEFITESLRNLNGHRLRFAIVHAITATELVLKERLARLNPALVYRNIDTKSPQREQTVSLAALPQRLANLGIPLDSAQAQLIRDIAEWRHQIVHHMASFDAQVARRQLPLLLDFLACFLRTALDAPLETFLPTDLHKVAQGLLIDWQKAVVAAQANATQEGNVILDICPRCGGAEVMCLRKDAAVHCHLCGAALYRCNSCDGCGRMTVIAYAPHEGSNFCDECIEAAGDAYIQMQIDIARGK